MEQSSTTLAELSQAFFLSLSEKERRLFAAQQSLERGYGGISSVHRQYGISFNAIQRGRRELQSGTMLTSDRQRRVGGGRKKKRTILLPKLNSMP
jgi:hypothetical protein